MAGKYLSRDDASFGENVWQTLDKVVIQAAKGQLSARKILDIEGPYGLGLKSVPLDDFSISNGDVKMSSAKSLSLALLETTFSLGARDIATFEETGFPFNAQDVAEAAIKIAETEDNLVFYGNSELGVSGLLNAEGVQSYKLSDWIKVGAAVEDIIKTVTILDNSGFHGSYLLALAPAYYNKLFRLYPNGGVSELEHINEVIGTKAVKAPSIKKGGVLIATGKQYASLIIGQDLITGFIGPCDSGYEFKITESIAPRIKVPSAVCILE